MVRLTRALEVSPKSAWLRRPESKIEEIVSWVEQALGGPAERGVLMTVETEVKYAGYLGQQQRQMERLRGSDARPIPIAIEFRLIPGLSREVAEKLTHVRPATLGQASRIPGVTAAAVAILDLHLTLASAPAV